MENKITVYQTTLHAMLKGIKKYILAKLTVENIRQTNEKS